MHQFLSDSFKIAVLLNPFAVLSTFIALTGDRTTDEKKNCHVFWRIDNFIIT